MNGLVYHGPGQKAWEDVPEPAIYKVPAKLYKLAHLVAIDLDDGRLERATRVGEEPMQPEEAAVGV